MKIGRRKHGAITMNGTMETEGQVTLHTLHDLALLYLGLAKGADKDLDPSETKEMAIKLRRWQPQRDPALIDHVIREAMMTYLNDPTDERLQEAAESLTSSFSENLRYLILQDLSDIAKADGRVRTGETAYIQSLAEIWNVNVQEN